MSSLYILRGPLRRSLLARPSHILKRYKFSARGSKSSDIKQDTSLNPLELRENHLPRFPARTRFAPSPTGYLHIGSLRTALYNYLLAKATGGQFILRIEDTDQSRIVPDAEERLYEDLKWAGLSWDEGPDVGGPYKPYKQSENISVYSKYADQLMNDGHAYRCFCSPEELDQMRSINIRQGNPTIYNGRCSHIPSDVSAQRAADGHGHCIRFKRESLPIRSDTIRDLVYGNAISIRPDDDFILIKQDGYPTYHFANVIDDHRMKITHVVRGAEWLISTPKHIALYRAFGWDIPIFAHVGLLTNKQGQKLSKRHGDVEIASWRDRGYLPITLLNYVLFLGWSTGKGVEGQSQVFDLEEMVNKFHLNFTKGNIIVNEKYDFLQKGHLQRLLSYSPDKFCDIVEPGIIAQIEEYEQQRKDPRLEPDKIPAQLGRIIPPAKAPPFSGGTVSKSYIRKIVEADAKNYKTAELFVERIRYLIWEVPLPIYVEAYKESIANRTLHFVEQEIAPANDDGTLTEFTEFTEFTDTRVNLSFLTSKLLDRLNAIPEEEWTVQGIQTALKPLIQSVFSVAKIETKPGGAQAANIQCWGWYLLRWALTGMKSGPRLVQSMVLMGRADTIKRIEVALKVAKRLDGDEAGDTPD
ncbi:uncharacterized protein F4807DRAFT_410982 [Annulohypoxylon truncatum]|uniref:uncharacterized protein n=1 Tax=Annulohypoxylon truncatum TaxID=327061 RepID=UPI0020077179|nr:uncharacterized protein F4807DRAFT_410982 [Annulohypoxylon truncatum]KAI1213414.1 hypothetical protein F4807DRAFT_410982 [Annulohypoxylon truncatum]